MDDLLRELLAINLAARIKCDYDKTLALLRALKAGTISLDQVTLTPDGWQLDVPAAAAADKIAVDIRITDHHALA